MTDFRRAVTPALWAALWAFLGPVLLLLLDVIQTIAEWASTSGATPLPGLSAIGYALVAAACSGASFVVAFAVRYAQTKGVIGGNTPSYKEEPMVDRKRDASGRFVASESGHADTGLVTAISCAVVAVVVVLWAVGVDFPLD